MMRFLLFVFAGVLSVTVYLAVLNVQYEQQRSLLVNQVQRLRLDRDQVNAEWTQLLLEQKVLADDAVVNHAVQQAMNMHVPAADQVVLLD